VVQGITGAVGARQTRLSLDYGTNVVAGVTPGKGGEVVEGLPVYDEVGEAVENHGANASVVFVPAQYAPKAVHDALDAGITLIALITEHIPVRDALGLKSHAVDCGAVIIGPNCPGLLSTRIGRMGIIPCQAVSPGRVGVVSRSGTLAFEVAADLTAAGIGQSTIVGIGGDPVPCTSFVDVLAAFEKDSETDAVVLVGEIGGAAEEKAAYYIERTMGKPVLAYVAGLSAPPGKKMGHAGAIVRGSSGTAASKIAALRSAGVTVAEQPSDLPRLLLERLAATGRSPGAG